MARKTHSSSALTHVTSLLFGLGIPAIFAGIYEAALGLPAAYVWLVAINLMALAVMGKDKFMATKGGTRTPEFTLLVLTFAGATFAILLGCKLFNHKTSKGSFRYALWGTIALQIACIYYFRAPLAHWLGVSLPV